MDNQYHKAKDIDKFSQLWVFLSSDKCVHLKEAGFLIANDIIRTTNEVT